MVGRSTPCWSYRDSKWHAVLLFRYTQHVRACAAETRCPALVLISQMETKKKITVLLCRMCCELFVHITRTVCEFTVRMIVVSPYGLSEDQFIQRIKKYSELSSNAGDTLIESSVFGKSAFYEINNVWD
jgi:hypothetical protein